MSIFEDFLLKQKELITNYYYDNNEKLNIQQIEIVPKLFNRIFFNVPIYYDREQDRQLNNIFIIFFLQYIYKKVDMTFNNYEKYLQDIIDEEKLEKIFNTYKSYSFKIGKFNRRHIVYIDYSSVSYDIVQYELGNNETIQLNILTNTFNKQNNQIQQLYFYIFPLFLNWLNDRNVDFRMTEKWQNFFTLDIGW